MEDVAVEMFAVDGVRLLEHGALGQIRSLLGVVSDLVNHLRLLLGALVWPCLLGEPHKVQTVGLAEDVVPDAIGYLLHVLLELPEDGVLLEVCVTCANCLHSNVE